MPCHQCMRQAQDDAIAMLIWMNSACRGWTLWRVAALQQAYCSRCARTQCSAWRCWRARQLLRLCRRHQIQLRVHNRQQEPPHQQLAVWLLKRKARLCQQRSALASKALVPAMRMLIPCWWCSGSSTHWIVCWKCCATDAAVLNDQPDQMVEPSRRCYASDIETRLQAHVLLSSASSGRKRIARSWWFLLIGPGGEVCSSG
jgi:hypothetical protein